MRACQAARADGCEIVDEDAPDERVREARSGPCPPSTSTRMRSRDRAREMIVGRRMSPRTSARTLASIVSPRSAATARASRQSSPSRAKRARDHLAHAVRHAPRVRVRPEILLGHEQLDDLADEERVAVGLAVQLVAERRQRRRVRAGRGDPARAVLGPRAR